MVHVALLTVASAVRRATAAQASAGAALLICIAALVVRLHTAYVVLYHHPLHHLLLRLPLRRLRQPLQSLAPSPLTARAVLPMGARFALLATAALYRAGVVLHLNTVVLDARLRMVCAVPCPRLRLLVATRVALRTVVRRAPMASAALNGDTAALLLSIAALAAKSRMACAA